MKLPWEEEPIGSLLKLFDCTVQQLEAINDGGGDEDESNKKVDD
ncbi:hypothetical protein BpsS140_00063 [Bacillus phage vB_BpsS-140]|nr:hypothetical protein BpsS140_00063 [Bacillus phage vB_BpsS-140]